VKFGLRTLSPTSAMAAPIECTWASPKTPKSTSVGLPTSVSTMEWHRLLRAVLTMLLAHRVIARARGGSHRIDAATSVHKESACQFGREMFVVSHSIDTVSVLEDVSLNFVGERLRETRTQMLEERDRLMREDRDRQMTTVVAASRSGDSGTTFLKVNESPI
jgi:hypothetical protein